MYIWNICIYTYMSIYIACSYIHNKYFFIYINRDEYHINIDANILNIKSTN